MPAKIVRRTARVPARVTGQAPGIVQAPETVRQVAGSGITPRSDRAGAAVPLIAAAVAVAPAPFIVAVAALLTAAVAAAAERCGRMAVAAAACAVVAAAAC